MATYCNILQHTSLWSERSHSMADTAAYRHCNTLQHTATHCNPLQHITLTLQHMATQCNTLQHTATHHTYTAAYRHYNKSFCVAVLYDTLPCSSATYLMGSHRWHAWIRAQILTLQHTATYCNILQHTATHCSTLQHTATHYMDTHNIELGRSVITCQCVVVCCGVLRCVAVCCSVLQYVAVCCSVLQWAAMGCSGLHYVEVCCSVLPCVAVSLLASGYCCCACDSVCVGDCITLQHAATRCNTLQHTASHCNTLQYITLQHTATHVINTHPNPWCIIGRSVEARGSHGQLYCNTLQHTAIASHCNLFVGDGQHQFALPVHKSQTLLPKP